MVSQFLWSQEDLGEACFNKNKGLFMIIYSGVICKCSVFKTSENHWLLEPQRAKQTTLLYKKLHIVLKYYLYNVLNSHIPEPVSGLSLLFHWAIDQSLFFWKYIEFMSNLGDNCYLDNIKSSYLGPLSKCHIFFFQFLYISARYGVTGDYFLILLLL